MRAKDNGRGRRPCEQSSDQETNGGARACALEPARTVGSVSNASSQTHALVLALQGDENERRRTKNGGAADARAAGHTATAVHRRAVRRHCVTVFGLGHARTDRGHVKRIGNGVGDSAHRTDRRNQLHQNGKHDDWNQSFQPPSHFFTPAVSRIHKSWCERQVHKSHPSRLQAAKGIRMRRIRKTALKRPD